MCACVCACVRACMHVCVCEMLGGEPRDEEVPSPPATPWPTSGLVPGEHPSGAAAPSAQPGRPGSPCGFDNIESVTSWSHNRWRLVGVDRGRSMAYQGCCGHFASRKRVMRNQQEWGPGPGRGGWNPRVQECYHNSKALQRWTENFKSALPLNSWGMKVVCWVRGPCQLLLLGFPGGSEGK